jgi:hypothetical protein
LRLTFIGKAEVGLADPADTGMLLGLFHAASGAFNQTNFQLYPNWEEATVRGNMTLSGRIWLADILRISLKAVFSKSVRRIWWPYVKEKLNLFRIIRPQTVEQ